MFVYQTKSQVLTFCTLHIFLCYHFIWYSIIHSTLYSPSLICIITIKHLPHVVRTGLLYGKLLDEGLCHNYGVALHNVVISICVQQINNTSNNIVIIIHLKNIFSSIPSWMTCNQKNKTKQKKNTTLQIIPLQCMIGQLRSCALQSPQTDMLFRQTSERQR